MEGWYSAPDEVVFQNGASFSVPLLKRYNSDTDLSVLATDLGRVLSQESINRDELKNLTEDVFPPNGCYNEPLSSPLSCQGRVCNGTSEVQDHYLASSGSWKKPKLEETSEPEASSFRVASCDLREDQSWSSSNALAGHLTSQVYDDLCEPACDVSLGPDEVFIFDREENLSTIGTQETGSRSCEDDTIILESQADDPYQSQDDNEFNIHQVESMYSMNQNLAEPLIGCGGDGHPLVHNKEYEDFEERLIPLTFTNPVELKRKLRSRNLIPPTQTTEGDLSVTFKNNLEEKPFLSDSNRKLRGQKNSSRNQPLSNLQTMVPSQLTFGEAQPVNLITLPIKSNDSCNQRLKRDSVMGNETLNYPSKDVLPKIREIVDFEFPSKRVLSRHPRIGLSRLENVKPLHKRVNLKKFI